MLRLTRVSKTYAAHGVETHALADVDLEVVSGEFVAVTGSSGSGKTTFLNIAGLLEPASTGAVEIDGQAVAGLSDDELARLRGAKIGFVFQAFHLMPTLNVVDNVDVPLRYQGLSAGERQKRVDESLGFVGLSSRAGHYPGQLSGGQKQRVAIARALAMKPRLLLADEPTGNLDSEMAAEVFELIDEVNRAGTTIVMVTHDPQLAVRAQRIVHIQDGRLVPAP